MKRFLILAAAMLLPLLPCSPDRAAPPAACVAWAAEVQPTPAPLASLPRAVDPLRIILPEGEVLPGEDYDLPVSGLSVNDLVPGKLLFLPPESSACRVKLVVQWSIGGLEPVITFRAKEPGSYRLVVVKALPNEQMLSAVATVTVKGDVTPPPPPPPPPTKLTAVAIVAETETYSKLPLAQRQLLASVTWPKAVEAKGLKYRRIDPNDKLSAEWQAAVKTADAKLPALVFLDASGAGSAIPLPTDEASAILELNGRAKP